MVSRAKEADYCAFLKDARDTQKLVVGYIASGALPTKSVLPRPPCPEDVVSVDATGAYVHADFAKETLAFITKGKGKDNARACVAEIKRLHRQGALDDHLMPSDVPGSFDEPDVNASRKTYRTPSPPKPEPRSLPDTWQMVTDFLRQRAPNHMDFQYDGDYPKNNPSSA